MRLSFSSAIQCIFLLLSVFEAIAQPSECIPYPGPISLLEQNYAIHATRAAALSDIRFYEVKPQYVDFDERPKSCYVSESHVASRSMTLLIQGGAEPSGICLWLEPADGSEPYELRIRDDFNYDWRLLKWKIPRSLQGKEVTLHVGLLRGGPYPQTIRFSDVFEWKGIHIKSKYSWSDASKYLLYFPLFLAVFSIPGILIHRWSSRFLAELPMLKLPIILTGSLIFCYLLFWVYFLYPAAGELIALLVITLGAFECIRKWRDYLLPLPDRETIAASLLVLAGLALSLGSGMLYGGWENPVDTAAKRYLPEALPADNNMPVLHAERILEDFPIKPYFMEQQSSDRPPLQSSVLMFLDVLTWEPATQETVIGMILQASAVACIFLFLRSLEISRWTALTCTVGVMFSGNFIAHSFYVWPKLLPAGLLAVLLMLLFSQRLKEFQSTKFWTIWVGTLTALALLSHGGSIFALFPIYLVWVLGNPGRRIIQGIQAFIPFLALVCLWTWYQKVWDPPGDGMLKWHLAGYIYPTEESFLTILKQQYSLLTVDTWLEGKIENLKSVFGSYEDMLGLLREKPWVEGFAKIRAEAFYRLFISFGMWNLCWLLLPFALFKQGEARVTIFRLFSIWVAGVIIWILVMYLPGSTAIHHGSLFFPVLGTVILILVSAHIHKHLPTVLLAINIPAFIITWTWHPISNRVSDSIGYSVMHSDPAAIVSLLLAFVFIAAATKTLFHSKLEHKKVES
jgi:hypothetical protein